MNKNTYIDKVPVSIANTSNYFDPINNQLHLLNIDNISCQWIVGDVILGTYNEQLNVPITAITSEIGVINGRTSGMEHLHIFKIKSNEIYFTLRGSTHLAVIKMSTTGIITILDKITYTVYYNGQGPTHIMQVDNNYTLFRSYVGYHLLDIVNNKIYDVNAENIFDVIKWNNKYYATKWNIDRSMSLYLFDMTTRTVTGIALVTTPIFPAETSYCVNYLKGDYLYAFSGISMSLNGTCEINMKTMTSSIMNQMFDFAPLDDVEDSVNRYFIDSNYLITSGNMTYTSGAQEAYIIDNVSNHKPTLVNLFDIMFYYYYGISSYDTTYLFKLNNKLMCSVCVTVDADIYTSYMVVMEISSNLSLKTSSQMNSILSLFTQNKNLLLIAAVGIAAFFLFKRKKNNNQLEENDDDNWL